MKSEVKGTATSKRLGNTAVDNRPIVTYEGVGESCIKMSFVFLYLYLIF